MPSALFDANMVAFLSGIYLSDICFRSFGKLSMCRNVLRLFTIYGMFPIFQRFIDKVLLICKSFMLTFHFTSNIKLSSTLNVVLFLYLLPLYFFQIQLNFNNVVESNKWPKPISSHDLLILVYIISFDEE